MKMIHASRGYTLGEMVIVLALLSCLTAALLYGARVGIQSMNLYVAQKQAQGLAQLLRVDFELASATHSINRLTDFFGTLYTRQWPIEANSVFGSPNAMILEERELVLNAQGCPLAVMALKPCWSANEGVRVELYDTRTRQLLSVVRPSVLDSGARALVGLGMDAIMVQNHYFQQRSALSDIDLEETADERRSAARSHGRLNQGRESGE